MNWRSKWVWVTDHVENPIQRCFFRQRFSLSSQGSLQVHVSADSRYKLYLDGQWIGEGPAAGDLMNYRYESYGHDLSVELEPGNHMIAIEVLSYGRLGPVNEIHERGGLIVEGGIVDEEGNALVDLSTPGEWLVWKDTSFGTDFSMGGIPFFCSIGFTENINFRSFPAGWNQFEFDDGGWGVPVTVGENKGTPVFSDPPTFTTSPWLLTPREVPPMEKNEQRFFGLLRSCGTVHVSKWQGLLQEDHSLTVPAGSSVSVVLSPEAYVTAYPQLEFEGGRDTRIRLTYAEAFSRKWKKGVRDDLEGRDVEGYSDQLTCGGERFNYTPFQWRAFRFLKLDIETGDTPLVLNRLNLLTSSYPLNLQASWSCGQTLLNNLWPVSWTALRTGAHEHLQDSPYYERLQYVGDSNIQAMTICRLSGDTRLWKRAVLDFNASRLPMGLTQSRYPSRQVQVIPTFSLIYIFMVEEYFLHTNDRKTVKTCLRGLEQIVDWFSDYLLPDGYLGASPWWNFVDWTKEWLGGDPSGMTFAQPGNKEPSATINFHFIMALRSLSKIYQWLGEAEKADQVNDRIRALQAAVRSIFWNAEKGLYREVSSLEMYSEHAQVLAVLTDTAKPAERTAIAEELDGSASLVRCGYQFEFYLARALSKSGRNDLMQKRLERWQNIFDLHLLTTPERPLEEGFSQRSDNHAWSAWTPQWMLSEVLGVQPLEPGFEKIQIKPQLGSLQFAEGSMPIPSGLLRLKVEVEGSTWLISGDLPPSEYVLEDLSGRVHEFRGGSIDLSGSFE